MLTEENVYLGSDNIIALALKLQYQDITHVSATTADTVIDSHSHPVITRCKLTIKKIIDDTTDADMTVDSQTDSSLFDFTDPEILKFKLGGKAIKPGRHVCKITIYESGSVGGLVWGEIMLTVQ